MRSAWGNTGIIISILATLAAVFCFNKVDRFDLPIERSIAKIHRAQRVFSGSRRTDRQHADLAGAGDGSSFLRASTVELFDVTNYTNNSGKCLRTRG
jgi:hypothetical protein